MQGSSTKGTPDRRRRKKGVSTYFCMSLLDVEMPSPYMYVGLLRALTFGRDTVASSSFSACGYSNLNIGHQRHSPTDLYRISPITAMPPTPQTVVYDRRASQRQAALACSEDEIWSVAQTQKRPGAALLCAPLAFAYPPSNKDPKFFVKCAEIGGSSLLEAEKRNHEFAYETLHRLGPQQPASEQWSLLVCVPEIYRAFGYRGFYFLVMEFISGRTLNELLNVRAGDGAGSQADESTLYRYIAEGIRLLSVKAPPGAKPGPVGGGIIRHPLFKGFEAAVPYRDVEMMEAHFNKVRPFTAVLSTEPLPQQHSRKC